MKLKPENAIRLQLILNMGYDQWQDAVSNKYIDKIIDRNALITLNDIEIEELFDELYDEISDDLYTFRSEGGERTDLDTRSGYGYVMHVRVAQLHNGDHVAWNCWEGGGKHGEPDMYEEEWLENARYVNAKEVMKLVKEYSYED